MMKIWKQFGTRVKGSRFSTFHHFWSLIIYWNAVLGYWFGFERIKTMMKIWQQLGTRVKGSRVSTYHFWLYERSGSCLDQGPFVRDCHYLSLLHFLNKSYTLEFDRLWFGFCTKWYSVFVNRILGYSFCWSIFSEFEVIFLVIWWFYL